MKKLILIVVTFTLFLGVLVAQAAPAFACMGLTPGYWKNHTENWPTTYTTGQTLDSVFDVPDALGLGDYTLLEALKFPGGRGDVGGARILLRAAVAALLNSAYFAGAYYTYEYDTDKVKSLTNAALAGDRADMISQGEDFDKWNNTQP